MNYLEYLLTVDSSVKEVKLFGLGEPLLGRYAELFWKFMREDQALAQKRSFASFGWGLLATLSYYFAYAWIIFETIGGVITLGAMTMYLSIFRSSQNVFQTLFFSLSDLYENALFMSNLFAFLDLKPQMPVTANPIALPRPIVHGLEFRNVSFKYPDRDAYALRDVSLTIKPGEKIALVGANGAGKTTFVKLLTRLYDPSEGQILIDGIDLREVDPKELQKRIGVIFQDFVQLSSTRPREHRFWADRCSWRTRRALSIRPPRGCGRDDSRAAAGLRYDAGQVVRARQRSVRRGVAEGGAGPRLYARGRGAGAGRANRGAGRHERVRDLPAFPRTDRQQDRAADQPSLFDGAHGRSDCGAGGRAHHRDGHARGLLALGGEYAKLFTIQAEGYK